MLFRNVVIFGAGTMGHAIALRFARLADMPSPSPTSTGTLWIGRNGPSADLRARSPSSWEEKRRKASWPGLRFREDGFGAAAGAELVVEVFGTG